MVLPDQHEAVEAAAAGDECGGNVEPFRRCDQNGFALEIDDDRGRPTGTFSPVVGGACVAAGAPALDADVRVLTDGSAVTHTGTHKALTSWDLCWRDPDAGVGTVTAYVAVVDGNGGLGTEAFPSDTTGDDVAAGAVPIAERGAAGDASQSGGCAAARPGDAAPSLVLAILAGALVLARRRRLRTRTVVTLLVASLAGCAHVRPRQREVLARRNMTFAPDPVEDELDLHMQEAREGSSGGYGSSGGGCGCN